MELKTNTLNEHNIQSTGKVTNMKLDEESQAMIFQLFTGGLYSDPIGTVIREITSNCFDSHVEAGVDSAKNPVIVEIKREASSNFIVFTDKGVGMSPERIEKIYGTYFKSTKRTTNDQIGGFGLGGKTPLAYTSSFFIVTRFDGIEYVYNVYEGNNVPAIELMSQTSTDKGNGTTVKVPIKDSDLMEFEQKTLRQLYYFENIVFKGFSDRYVTNEYNIVRGENFLYRGDAYSDRMHVCYGKVAYPLDFSAIGLDGHDHRIPVAIKINIGELEGSGVTPSREALMYSKENVRIIKDKINAVKEELKELLSKQYDNVQTIEEYYKAVNGFGNLYFDDYNKIHLGSMFKKSEVTYPNFKYNDLVMPDYVDILSDFYNVKLYGKKYPKSRWGGDNGWVKTINTMEDYDNIYYNDGEFKRKVVKQAYLKAISDTENFYIVTPKEFTDTHTTYLLRKYGVLQEILNDDSTSDEVKFKSLIPRKKAEKLLAEMAKEIHGLIAKHAKKYDDVEVSDDFIESRKRNKLSEELLKTTIPVNCTRSGRNRLTLKQLQDLKGRIYYGFRDDESDVRRAYNAQSYLTERDTTTSARYIESRYSDPSDKRGTLFITISKGNEKYMDMLGKKALHVDYFYKTYIVRKIDLILESKISEEIKKRFNNNVLDLFYSHNMQHFCKETYKKAIEIQDAIREMPDSDAAWYVNLGKVERELNVDITELVKEHKFKFETELSELEELSAKNKNRLQWFSMPHYVDPERDDHKELIDMVKLMFEK